jgi:CDP-glycerol glycerophosphotransferase
MKHCPWRKSLKCVFRRILWIGRKPTVSVVVPVYKVEAYLPACLDSILAQSYERLEVICVDDGSPDNSIDVLRAYAAKDDRIRIVRQDNSGLGAARNNGVAKSTGDMLFFVDSDDTIPPWAVEHLLTSLMRSGSDFAVGSVMRDTSTGRHIPNWAKQLHATTRTRLSLAAEPEALKNVFAPTKMFRRRFFESVVGRFPDGVYEDQVPAAKAYIHGTFDIIKDIVCYYHIRDDGSSITQQKASMSDLASRWQTIHAVSQNMAQAPAPVLRTWQAKVLGFDMRPYYEQIPRTEDDYWHFLHDQVRAFADSVGYNIFANVPIYDRLLAVATYHGYRDDVRELLCRRESFGWRVPGIIHRGKPRVTDEFFEGLQLDADGVLETLEAPDDILLIQHVDSVTINGNELTVRGSAYLSNLNQKFANSELALVARPKGARDQTRDLVPIRLSRHREAAADLRAKDPWNDHAESGFEAVFSLTEMHARSWDLILSLTIGEVSRNAVLSSPDATTSGRLPSFGQLTEHGRWYMVLDRQTGGLQLRRTATAQVAVDEVSAGAGFFSVRLAKSLSPKEGQFLATGCSRDRSRAPDRIAGTLFSDRGRTFVRFAISHVSSSETEWTLWWETCKQRIQLGWSGDRSSVVGEAARPYLISLSAAGGIIVKTGPLIGEVDTASLCNGGLVVSGWFQRDLSLANENIRARLWNRLASGPLVPVQVSNGEFEVSLPFTDNLATTPHHTHGYGVVLEVPGREPAWPRVSEKLLASMPTKNRCERVAARFSVTTQARALWVKLEAPLADNERSRRAQHLLQQDYRCHQNPENAVLFECMNGRSIGDSPLALSSQLHRSRPALRQYWSVESLSLPVPAWATPLLRYSAQWYNVLASARLLVNNNNWPWFFTKRPYQTYLQTWHGTPLKRIGNDVPKANLSLSYRALMQREALAWDALLAQNHYSAAIFRRAFGFQGEILQFGYPRNDALVDSSATATRERIRNTLGISEQTTVLLYAPTWRDNLKSQGGYARVSFLDFHELRLKLGNNLFVLYRGHPNTANAPGKLPDFVFDATRYPNLNDLMLASDLLVTDYSSVLFDYAVMRKPIYFLAPDRDAYSTATRGFYLPFEEVAPGPIVTTTSDLADAVSRHAAGRYKDRLEAFVAEFAARDDGGAAERVTEYLAPFL